MIARIWNGWTTIENADKYEQLVREEVFPGIAAESDSGNIKLQLLRRTLNDEVEFTTIIWFESLDAVKKFAGEDYEQSYIPEKAHALLSRFNQQAHHYELKVDL